MTTIKTQDLTGAALDWGVAVSVDRKIKAIVNIGDENETIDSYKCTAIDLEEFSPSTEWSQGGPLIETFNIGVCPTDFEWVAQKDSTDMSCQCDGVGPTPLIAACRAIVSAKLGNYFDVPEELA